MRKPTLSPTRIATYLECAIKYRYVYVDRIGRYYLRAKPGYSFGATLHRVLQRFHQDGAAASAESLAQHYEQSWIPAGYETAEQERMYREAGAGIVQAYHADARGRAKLGAETVLTERTIRTDMGPFVLFGRVDRVDRHPDGALEIVDYKSGRLAVTPEDVAEDLAMSVYQLIMRRNHPGATVFATIYCLRSGATASAAMTDADAERFGSDIRALGAEILDRDFEGVEPTRIDACEECEFRSRCEAFWRTRKSDT